MQSSPSSQMYVVGIDSHNRIQNTVRDAKTNTISILDTAPNTDSSKTDPYNSTNNVAIPTSVPQKQLVEMTLSSISLPKKQFTIESLWNRLFVSEQIELMVADVSQISRTQFTLELSDGGSVTAQLPPYLNPIVDIQAVPGDPGLTNITFTTAFAHGLHLADFWAGWGDPVRLVSVGIVDPLVATLSSTNTHLSITASNQFQLNGLAAAQFTGTFPINGSGFFGYVWAPGIPGPIYLAQIVTAALNVELDEYASSVGVPVSHVRLYYNLQDGLFTLVVESLPITASREIIDPVAIGQVSVNAPTLAYIMGFGNCCIANSRDIQNRLANGLDRISPGAIGREYPRSGSVQGSFGPLFRTFLDLDIGDYDSVSALGSDIELNWNRFWFDPSCTIYTVTTYRFVFTDACGICFEFIIPFGLYTPEQIAQFLQVQMNAATGTNIYQVTYDSTTSRFTFRTTNNSIFGLKFSDTPFIMFNSQNDLNQSIPVQIYQVPPQFTTVAVRMGFDNVNYRGESSYTSIRPVAVPKKQLICNEILAQGSVPRRFQFVAQWKTDGSSIRLLNRSRFAVYAFTPTLNNSSLQFSGGQLLISTAIANGIQVNDIVRVAIASGVTLFLRVIQVLSPFQFLVDVNGDLLTLLGVVDGGPLIAACVENATLPIINLYMSQNLYNSNISMNAAGCGNGNGVPCNSNPNNPDRNGPIAPRLLGMGSEDVLWDASTKFPFVGMADVVLHFPDYLLIVVSLDNGTPCATHTHHLWKLGKDNNLCVLAIVLNHHSPGTLVWERFIPSTVQFSSPTKVGSFKFQILNPDHSLYQLHNVDWSGTLNIQVVQASGQLLS